MSCKTFTLVVLIAGLCITASAGDIEGKVSGMKGQSVVYVDVIAGKTFSRSQRPSSHGIKKDCCLPRTFIGSATRHNG